MKSLKTVQTISKVFYILTTIGFIFGIIGVAGSALGGIALLCVPYLGENIVNIIISDFEIVNTNDLGIILIAESIYMVGVAVGLGFIRHYFKNELKDGTPFTYCGAKELLRAGIINMTVPVVSICIAAMICTIAGVSEPELSNESEMISGVTMLILSFVFRYGADLLEGKQTEATDSNE